jgi:WD40 repeat protein
MRLVSQWLRAVILVVTVLVAGCGTTPGRDKPLDTIVEVVASPDGKLIAASTFYDEVVLFDFPPLNFKSFLTREGDRRETSRLRLPFAKQPFPNSSPALAFAPNGETLVAAGVRGNVIAWDVAFRREKFRVPVDVEVANVAFFPDGRAFVTAGPKAVLWDADSGARVTELELPSGAQAMSTAVSPDGRAILVGLSTGSIAIYDASSRRLVRTLQGHLAPVYAVAFSPDGAAIASTAGEYDPRLWKKDPAGEFGKGERAAGAAAAAAQGSVDQAQGLGIFVWLLGAVASVHTVGAPLGAPPLGASAEAQLAAAPTKIPNTCGPRVAFSPDGRYLAATTSIVLSGYGDLFELKHKLFLIDLEKGATRMARFFVCALAFTPDSKFVMTGQFALELAAPTLFTVETLKPLDLPGSYQ